LVKLTKETQVTGAVINLYEAKTSLSKLVERAAAGEEIIIAKAGKPKARLVPLAGRFEPRQPGGWERQGLGGRGFRRAFAGRHPCRIRGQGLTLGRPAAPRHARLHLVAGEQLAPRRRRARIASASVVFVNVASAWRQSRSRSAS
jgi:prevent-host-death family protein